jgi:hypothetical protein
MANKFEVLFKATAWELEPRDCIAYKGNSYIIKEIDEHENGYTLKVVDQKWSEDDEIIVGENEYLSVIRPEDIY